MKTLEQEFEEYKSKHKYSILKAILTNYYETIEKAEPDIPAFMQEHYRHSRAELLAQRDIRNLVLEMDGMKKFDAMYEKAWCHLAPTLT